MASLKFRLWRQWWVGKDAFISSSRTGSQFVCIPGLAAWKRRKRASERLAKLAISFATASMGRTIVLICPDAPRSMRARTGHAAEATTWYGSLHFLPVSKASLITLSKSSPGQNLPTHANAWHANHGSLISRARASAADGSPRTNELARSLACVGLSLIGTARDGRRSALTRSDL